MTHVRNSDGNSVCKLPALIWSNLVIILNCSGKACSRYISTSAGGRFANPSPLCWLQRGLSPSHLAGSAPPFPLVTAKGKPAAELSIRVCSNPSDARRCHQKGKVCDKWLGAPSDKLPWLEVPKPAFTDIFTPHGGNQLASGESRAHLPRSCCFLAPCFLLQLLSVAAVFTSQCSRMGSARSQHLSYFAVQRSHYERR